LKYCLFLFRIMRMSIFSDMFFKIFRTLTATSVLLSFLSVSADELGNEAGYTLGEGNEIIVDKGIIIREMPLRVGDLLARIAVGTPEGYHFLYDPNLLVVEGFWSGQFGRVSEAGDFLPLNDRMKSFFLDKMPWSFGEAPHRSEVSLLWKGCNLSGGKVVLSYQIDAEEKGMQWDIEEVIEIIDENSQNIHFKITANKESDEYLNYWLRQTQFRKVKTNGQQNQRNLLKNLIPNQKQFTIEFLRKKESVSIPNGYSVQGVDIPSIEEPFRFEPTDFDFAQDGSVYVSTRTGGVWKYKDETWSLFADGLGEANGVRVAPDQRGVYVMHKPELTLLKDEDGDGIAEMYETAEDRFRFTGQYHEFAYGPRINSKGDIFFSLGLNAGGAHRAAPDGYRGQMTSPLGYRGWVLKKDQEGRVTPFAWGLRSPAGIGMNAQDELFVTDNQGDWVPASYLGHVEEGDFLGHPASSWDLPEYELTPGVMGFQSVNEKIKEVPQLDIEALKMKRKPPAVWLAHGDLTNSPGHPSFAPEEGFGPFGGQAFIADIAHRSITRVALEKIKGQYQGAAFPFIQKLSSSSYSTAFDASGNLWVGSVGRGWVAGDPMIEVIRYDNRKTPFEMHRVALAEDGFEVHFTDAVAEQVLTPEDIEIRCFQYEWWDTYGSEPINESSVQVKDIQFSEDRKMMKLTLPLKPEFVYQIQLPEMTAVSSLKLENNFAYYTLNNLLR